LVVDGQSSRSKVLTLDQSGSGDDNKRGRLVYFALPQGSERGRSLAVGDVDGDGRKDVVVSDPANAQVWVYFQTKGSGLSAGQSFPSLVGARTVRLAKPEGKSKEDVFILSEQEKQIGRGNLENGRLTFPTPLTIVGDPVAMDLAGQSGGKGPRIFYIVRAKPADAKAATDAFELRAMSPDKSGTFRPDIWEQAESVALPGVTAVPAALKTLDVNQDGQTDLLVFNQYGPPLLLLGQKEGPPRLFTSSLGPLSGATPAGVSQMDLGGPALIVAQNTFARRVLLDSQGHWNIKDQYNAGRTSAQILGAAALDTDGDGTKEIVLLDRASKSLLFLSLKDGVYRPNGSLSIGSINFEGMHVADFDGDGRDDLLVAGTDKFAVLQTGRKGLGLKTIATYESKRHEARLSDVAVGDVNADGSPDVVFTDTAEQSLEIATFTGDKELLPAITFKIFERKTFRNVGDLIEPRDMAIGDVDGDGRADIVLVIHDRVLVYRQDPGKAPAKPGQPSGKTPVAAKPKP
jgi:FG-GAP-like repeat/FG-GAP repeat